MLHKKYIVNKLKDLQGLVPVKNIVKKILKDPAKAPKLLVFSGSLGCGKSSVAEVLAKSFRCDKPLKDGSCCGKCGSCLKGDNYVKLTCPSFDEIQTYLNRFASIEFESTNYGVLELEDFDLSDPVDQTKTSHFVDLVQSVSRNQLVVICSCKEEWKLHPSVRSRFVNVQFPELSEEDKFRVMESVSNSEGIGLSEEVLRFIARDNRMSARECIKSLDLYRLDPSGEALQKDLETVKDLVTDFVLASINRDDDKVNEIIETLSKYSGDDIIREIEELALSVHVSYYM